MTLTTQEPKLNLQPGPNWSSFEKFRTEGAKALEPLKEGKVATLHTKTGQYRILEEHDFQQLLGLARDVERLQGGLRMLVQTVRVAQRHPDAESFNLLAEIVVTLGSLPELPISEGFESLLPECSDVDLDDEVELDPTQIERPLASGNVTLAR